MASPPTASTKTATAPMAAARSPHKTPTPIVGCAISSACCWRATTRKSFSSTPSSSCFRIRCSASRRRGGSSRSPGAQTASTLPTRSTPLRNGDEVEIICSAVQQPPVAWQSLAVTGKARSAIRRATRDAVRAQYGKLGREILDRAFQRHGKTFSEATLGAALGRLSQKTADDVMAAVGRGELASADVIRAVFPEEVPPEPPKRRREMKRTEEGWFGLGKVMGLKFRWPGSAGRGRPEGASGIPIRGLRGELPVNFAEGGAVPGDRIVGILTPGQGITIYPIHANALKAFDEEPERWIDVTWDIDEDNPQRFPAKIAATAMNEPGSLAQVASVIGEADGNIENIKLTNRVPDYTEMLIDLEVWDLQHLNEILAGLRAKDVVSSAARAEG